MAKRPTRVKVKRTVQGAACTFIWPTRVSCACGWFARYRLRQEPADVT
jgi:hypothetical protein